MSNFVQSVEYCPYNCGTQTVCAEVLKQLYYLGCHVMWKLIIVFYCLFSVRYFCPFPLVLCFFLSLCPFMLGFLLSFSFFVFIYLFCLVFWVPGLSLKVLVVVAID
jgi:hypothetical protein